MIRTDAVAEWGTLLGVALVAFLNQWNARRTRLHTSEVWRAVSNNETGRLASFASNANKLDDLKIITGQIHALVNSAMAEQLRLNMVIAQRLASLTKEDGDIVAAAESLKKYDDYMAKEAMATCALTHGCALFQLTQEETGRLKTLLAAKPHDVAPTQEVLPAPAPNATPTP